MMRHDKGGMMQQGMMMQHGAKPEHHARLREAATLADIKVQTTKFGAVVHLVAKKATDTVKVQELAKELAAHLTEPSEPGHSGHPNPARVHPGTAH